MRELLQEFRFAFRGFRKNPVLTAAALISLALGIGANTAIFSLMDQVLLRSLPVQHPGELVLLSAPGPRSGMVNTNYSDEVAFSYPMYCDFRDRAPGLAGVFARFPIRMSMSWGNQTQLAAGDLVSGTFFGVLGASTVLGRPITPEDDRLGKPNPVAVISYNLWTHQFGGSPAVLNKSVRLNGQPVTIVGVARQGFKGVAVGEAPDVFVPITMEPRLVQMFDGMADRRSYWLNIFARLQPGNRREPTEKLLNGFWKPILEQEAQNLNGASERGRKRFLARHLEVLPGGQGISWVRMQAEGPLMVLMGMVSVLLLIACVNVASLLIARAAGRQKEIAIRLAIGAGRSRLIRQLLIEGLGLSVAGALLGLLVAAWTGGLLLSYLPSGASLAGLQAEMDGRALAFSVTVAIVTGIFFGLAPALETFRMDVASSLKGQASNTTGTSVHVRFRKALVVAQVGLSLVLLIGAGLFGRSLLNLRDINPGFRTDHLLSFTVQPSLNGYTPVRTQSLYERLGRELAAMPQVRAVAMAEIPLLSGDNEVTSIHVPGYQAKEGESSGVNSNWIGAGYFSAIGIPLLRGREFAAQDSAKAPQVAVINEALAGKYFGSQDPIGRRLRHGRMADDSPGVEIVGLVKDGKNTALREKREPYLYLPYTQHDSLMQMTFYVRTAQDPATLGPALRKRVSEADPNLPVFDVKTVEQQIDENIFAERLVAMLSTLFGALATLLAAVGLYGVMAYTVSRRTREIGLRMALGAARRQVLRMVMREVGLLTLLGISIAVPAAYALSRLIESQLYQVKSGDPLSFAAATLALAIVAGVAGLIPAIRATRIDPMRALRNE